MNAQRQKKTGFPECKPHLLWRLLWVAMLLVHARPVAGLFIADRAFSPLSAFFLSLSSLFFVLKIVDVPWLRFRADFRAAVTWMLILSILHLGALNRTINQQNIDSASGIGVVFISCAAAGVLVAAGRHVVLCVLARTRRIRSNLALICQFVGEWCAKFHTLCLISRTCPRGPPL